MTIADKMRDLVLRRSAGGGRDKLRIIGGAQAMAAFIRACNAEDFQPQKHGAHFMGIPLIVPDGDAELESLAHVALVAIEGQVDTRKRDA